MTSCFSVSSPVPALLPDTTAILVSHYNSHSLIPHHYYTFLDNEYYRQLVGGGNGNDEDTDIEILADGPNWNQVEVDSGDVNRFQWNRGRGGGQLLMLNADIAVVRDLEGQHVDGEASCSFRNGNRCPLADTLTKAGIYRGNNEVWLADFKDAMYIMLEKGL